ncbi:hypothetical protein BN1723_016642, partial [Verticillium longisporum]
MKHRNIVQFLRAFSFNDCTFLVLELCPYGSLMEMVKKRKGLTEPEVRFYSIQIAGAIKYMHSKGIIHRDLKMGNIFLDRNMNTKVGDFGLAALLVTGKDMHTIRRTTLCGTPNYIAPEILEKGKKGHDHMVDIWSLEHRFAMLTSKPPFQSTSTDEIYRRARERDYEWPTMETAGKLISSEAKDIVATMLEDADRRPEPDSIVQHPDEFGPGHDNTADLFGSQDPSSTQPTDLVIFYQRLGDVGCWVFCDGHLQFNFPDHTKLVINAAGTWCHFWHLPQDAAESLAKTGTLDPKSLDERSTLSYPLQTLLNFQTKPSARTTTTTRRRPEIPADLQGIPAANDFRRKIHFIKDVVKEWVSHGGLGNSSMDRENRLMWAGHRETVNVKIPTKMTWVTIGARWGDDRLSAYVDPRNPTALGEEIDEPKRFARSHSS